jgi:hypothetical protein
VAYQFKPGESGNPGGKPKTRSFWDDVREELDTTVTVRGVAMTAQRAIAKTLVALARKGNLRAVGIAIREDGVEPGPHYINLIIAPDDARL